MKYLIFLVSILITLNSFAFDLKGIKVGDKTTHETVNKAFGIECADLNEAPYCLGRTTIAGNSVSLAITVDENQVVESLLVTFETDDFDSIKDALLKKFGKPTSNRKYIIGTAMGAKFQQHDINWHNKKSIASVSKYASTITEGSIYITTKDSLKKFDEARKKEQSDI